MPQGMYYRKGHWVRKGRRKAKTSGWLAIALVLGVAWVLLHSSTPSSAAPAPKQASVHVSSSPTAR